MQYATLLALAAALLVAEAKIAFTHTPGSSVDVGEAFSIEWDGATGGAPVTITLKKGNPNELTTVALLTGDGKNGEYVWTPSKELESGDDYALEISEGQGVDETNYSGEFSISGGKGSSASSSAAATSSGAAATTVVITSGTSSFTTMETGGASSGTMSSNQTTTKTSNVTITTASPTGGLQVSSNAPTTTPASSSSSGIAAIATGAVGGLAAALIGAAALL